MRLDAYRRCTWREKRGVLDVFWRRRAVASETVLRAAYEYGWWAVVALTVIALELGLVVALLAARSSGWGWWAGLAAVANGLALYRSVVRLREVEVAVEGLAARP